MFYIFLLTLFFTQSIASEEPKDNIRMGFNHGTAGISVIFPNEQSLKFKQTQDGHHIYFSNADRETSKIVYQFGYHGLGLEGLESFKNMYLEDLKSALLKKNKTGKCTVVSDQNQRRVIVDSKDEGGNRTIFVGDFYLIGNEIYLASEMIELVVSKETNEAIALIDESFFDSIELKNQ